MNDTRSSCLWGGEFFKKKKIYPKMTAPTGLAVHRTPIADSDARSILRTLIRKRRLRSESIEQIVNTPHLPPSWVVSGIFQKKSDPETYKKVMTALNGVLLGHRLPAITRLNDATAEAIRPAYTRACQRGRKGPEARAFLQKMDAERALHQQLERPFRVQTSDPVGRGIVGLNRQILGDLLDMLASRPIGRPRFRITPGLVRDIRSVSTA